MRRGTLTTQPEGNQEVRTSMGTTLPSATSPMRTTPSIRQPDSPMSKPDKTPSSAALFTTAAGRAPVAETICADGGGPMYNTTTLEVQDMDITAPEIFIMEYILIFSYHYLIGISDLFIGNTQLVSDTNSPMSILHIPNLKKMYGTSEYTIDINTGQLYTIADIDVTSINVYGGIPDDEVNRQVWESTLVPPKMPQATSTPITEAPRSVEETVIPRIRAPLPTPRMVTIHQEMESWTSSSTLSEPSGPVPMFNLQRANV